MAATIVADPGSCWRAAPDEPLERAWERALALIHYAKDAGADVIKWQLLRPAMYPDNSAPQRLIAPYCLPDEWLPRLQDVCDQDGIAFACTVYRPEDVPLVDALGVPFHKVASFESAHRKLLRAALATEKPVLVSLGTAQRTTDVLLAIRGRARKLRGLKWLTPLVCVSAYPAQVAQYDLRALIKDAHGWQDARGVSDHTPGPCVSVGAAAAALGAEYIEKHLRAPDSGDSPDAAFAATPAEFAAYVQGIRGVESTLAPGPRDLANEWRWARWDARTGRRGVPPVPDVTP